MRRTFADVLREGKINIKDEYNKLYSLMFGKYIIEGDKSLHDMIEEIFCYFSFRGTCLSLSEFDKKYGFHFEKEPKDFDVVYLVSFCEYFQNMLVGIQEVERTRRLRYQYININLLQNQIRLVIDNIGYMPVEDDGLIVYVEKSSAAISVSESPMIPKELSYKVLEYNHYSLRGNLNKKKVILLHLADLLEPKRKELNGINGNLCNDIFFAFNNLNIRHNNIDPDNSSNYKRLISSMKEEELEKWYDEVYQMCLLAFMELEEEERKHKFNTLKKKLN
ncbi:hypothetical protein [Sharpea azabuensis]|uniref:hypothetical protein n=1 Tax=Sharpea azabuensis TaxID=322505 RepID=UPI00051BDD3B|nr:hypothetical protein [Sharpea azabuensis]